jgi:hypothetical protein
MKRLVFVLIFSGWFTLGILNVDGHEYGPDYYSPYWNGAQHPFYPQQYDPYYELHVLHYQLYRPQYQLYYPYPYYCCAPGAIVIPGWTRSIAPLPRRAAGPHPRAFRRR